MTENKRLSEVLAHVMAQQDTAPLKVRPAGKQRSRYALTGNPNRGRKGWVEKRAERRAADALAMPSPPAE